MKPEINTERRTTPPRKGNGGETRGWIQRERERRIKKKVRNGNTRWYIEMIKKKERYKKRWAKHKMEST